MELEQDEYDVVVIGTGLAESIAAASLAKTGRSVLHLDPNEYYGSSQASLTLDELSSLASSSSASHLSRFSHFSTSPLSADLEASRRQYALSLFPSVLPSRGPLITTLIASDVSKYVSFRLLDSVSVWDNETGTVRRVPGSKEEVFKDTSVGLVDKRRLMKFLMWAGGEFENDQILQGKESQPLSEFLQQSFSLPPALAISITYAIAHCSTVTDATLPALQRTRRYLRSVGRYGSGAFLIGQYGGAGEVAQGFCRACAVHGGTYVLGSAGQPSSIELDGQKGVTVQIPGHPRPILAKHLITSPDHLPQSLNPPPDKSDTSRSRDSSEASKRTTTTAHCIAVLPSLPSCLTRPIPNDIQNEGEQEEGDGDSGNDDTAVVLFPPTADADEAQVVRGLMMGEGTGSCPSGQYILYLFTSKSADTDTDPSSILKPYLERLHSNPLFTCFYLQKHYYSSSSSSSSGSLSSSSNALSSKSPAIIVLDPYSGTELLTEGLDWEAEQGEAAFWAVVGDKEQVEEGKGFFDAPKVEGDESEPLDDDL
ncbi:GDP dissociation inhibitor-domain-containing protein [Naematelia encephala]|uniref:Rab proteins geranylgeranyltransferase n=1 Tax=Naematelia encephala TaxID=71784 RepID=A0A1Y2AP69_9TREE|nr:GDP dissociation inhibitor-domain-containing protein [Naematelia encephala]